MSTQSEREAAARAWWNTCSWVEMEALWEMCAVKPHHHFVSDGRKADLWPEWVSDWTRWAKADAAKAAPAREADALEGVVWAKPYAMLAYVEGTAALRAQGEDDKALDVLICAEDAATCSRIYRSADLTRVAWHSRIAAHARAQLAREASAAPAQPAALTLEQARAMCREAGDTVVTASGYERPDLVLAALEAFKRIDVRDMPRVRGAIANCEWVQEAKALCDLGVTPAVLS